MKRKIKKAGIFLSAVFAVCLIGQVAYAQTPIGYSFRLPETGSVNTTSVTKTNSDYYADNYCSYFGWPGSGVNWWLNRSSNGERVSVIGAFYTTGTTSANYTVSGSSLNGVSVYATLKTDLYTWNECDVKGSIYP